MKAIKNLGAFFGIQGLFGKRVLPENVTFLTDEEEKKRAEKYDAGLSSYRYTDELSDAHISFLDQVVEDENSRQSIIESKLAQIVGQSGVIFALIALFAPLFYDNLNELPMGWRIVVLVSFGIGFLFFLLSIIQATKSFNIRNFVYSRPDVESVLSKDHASKGRFIQQIVVDKIKGLPINVHSNSLKGNLLLYAYRSFIVGFISIGILGAIITSTFLFREKTPSVVVIEESAGVKQLTDQVTGMEARLTEINTVLSEQRRRSLERKDSVAFSALDDQIKLLQRELRELKTQLSAKRGK